MLSLPTLLLATLSLLTFTVAPPPPPPPISGTPVSSGNGQFTYVCSTQQSVQNTLIGLCPATKGTSALTGAFGKVDYVSSPYFLDLQCKYANNAICEYTNSNPSNPNQLILLSGTGCSPIDTLPQASYAPRRRAMDLVDYAGRKRVYVGGVRPAFDAPVTTGGQTGTFSITSTENRVGSLLGNNQDPYTVRYSQGNGGFTCDYDNTGDLSGGPAPTCPTNLCPASYPARKRSSSRDEEAVARRQVDTARVREGRKRGVKAGARGVKAWRK